MEHPRAVIFHFSLFKIEIQWDGCHCGKTISHQSGMWPNKYNNNINNLSPLGVVAIETMGTKALPGKELVDQEPISIEVLSLKQGNHFMMLGGNRLIKF